MQPTTAIIYDDIFLKHKTGRHVESPNRLTTALDALRSLSISASPRFEFVKPAVGPTELPLMVHGKEYVDEIRRFCSQGGGAYDGDTVLSRESYQVALAAANGVVTACEFVHTRKYENAFVLLRPPGHHAGVDGRALGASSVGFCVFNNVAIASSNILSRKFAKRVLIFDFDVHHGNGTQEIFNSSPDVLYASIHEKGIYPGTGWLSDVGEKEGRGFKINIPVPHRADTKICTGIFNTVLYPILEQFKPDFILVSAGFDAHHSDNISSTQLGTKGYEVIMDGLLLLTRRCAAGKIVACLEGGYSEGALTKALPAVVAKMGGADVEITDPAPEAIGAVKNEGERLISEARRVFSQYWSV